MWVPGLVGLMAITAALVALLNRGHTPAQVESRWDVVSLGNAYAAVAATLASFSVVTAVFLANFSQSADPGSVENVMALFLMSFIGLVGESLMFATVRSAQPSGDGASDMLLVRQMMYVLAIGAFFIDLSLGWLGLHPLLMALGLTKLAGVFTWVLLLVLAAGAARQGAWFRTLLGCTPAASYAVTVAPLVLAAAYRLAIVPVTPGLWPADATLMLALVTWGFGALPFMVETLMIRYYGGQKADRWLVQLAPRLTPPYIAMCIALLTCVWFSLVMPNP
jgi:hypothetical protein